MAYSANQILNVMIDQVKSTFHELSQRKDSYQKMVNDLSERNQTIAPQNFLLVKLNESLLEDLTFKLGVITTQLSCLNGIPVDIKAKLFDLNNDILESIDKLVELETCFTSEESASLEPNGASIRT